MPAQGQPSPPKKSRKGLILGGCGGCLGLFSLLCVCSGWLFYLEEGVSFDDPGEELTSVPIASAQPIALDVTWNGTGYVSMRTYVDLGAGAPEGVNVTGTFGCDEYGSLRMEEVDERYVRYSDALPEGWVRIPPHFLYHRASPAPVRCAGSITLPPGVTSARLVVTERQRPSDWLSEWF